MFPPFAATESVYTDEMNSLTRAYRDVVIYGDNNSEEALYEGPIVVHASGWIELEGGRLLSPQAVHHIDIYDDDLEGWDGDGAGDDRSDDDGSGDDEAQPNRFRP